MYKLVHPALTNGKKIGLARARVFWGSFPVRKINKKRKKLTGRIPFLDLTGVKLEGFTNLTTLYIQIIVSIFSFELNSIE